MAFSFLHFEGKCKLLKNSKDYNNNNNKYNENPTKKRSSLIGFLGYLISV
jgi:hypothetical protein